MTESNVVPLEVRYRKVFQTITIWIDDKRPPHMHEMIALQFIGRDGKAGEPLISNWGGWTGRDGNGRFVKVGSDDEHCDLGCLLASRKELAPGGCVKFLGVIAWCGQPELRPVMMKMPPGPAA